MRPKVDTLREFLSITNLIPTRSSTFSWNVMGYWNVLTIKFTKLSDTLTESITLWLASSRSFYTEGYETPQNS